MSWAIRIDGLGKRYRIAGVRRPYDTLREQIVRAATAPARRIASVLRGEGTFGFEESIWALEDVSFEVATGEVLGVIGHNGAGKTTLLKILSRITEPTTGRVEIRGRVGSLLEVGTGFHPELTGRENVFLNGAILGMRRDETRAKFDRIVEFAEIGRFVETPVKFYSSGMYVRLAFAVAAHLDPEVLLIDEVLAVGDAGFQKKCIASLRESTSAGKTALVVSHNMSFVRSLCSRVVLLEHGRVIADGPPDEVVGSYYRSLAAEERMYLAPPERRSQPVAVAHVLLRDPSGEATTEVPAGAGLQVEIGLDLSAGARLDRPWIGVRLFSWHGELISHVANREAGSELPAIEESSTVTCRIESLNLLPGQYYLGVVVADTQNEIHDRIEQALPFTVTPADVHGSGMLPTSAHGVVFLHSRWSAGRGSEVATGPLTAARSPV